VSPADLAITLRYADSVEELDVVEPMWNALQEHHARITPELDPRTPKRELADAWRVRRSKYVRWLSVLPDRRSDGVGAALLETAWSRLEERGIDDMAITTTKTNVDAHRFYERQGFSQGFVVYHGKRSGS
jgi:GNAT superfamily N-acetyltransferase